MSASLLLSLTWLATARAETPTEGVSGAAAAAVAAAVKQTSTASNDAWKQYAERYVHFQQLTTVNAANGAIMGRNLLAYHGKYNEQLAGADFYDYVGRKDLGDALRKYRSVAVPTNLIGYTSLAAAVGLLTAGYTMTADLPTRAMIDNSCEDWDENDDLYVNEDCVRREQADKEAKLNAAAPYKTAGWASLGVALVAGIGVPIFNKAPKLTQAQALRLADEYNAKLRAELGIPEGAEPPAGLFRLPQGPTLSGSLLALPDGGGVSLHGTF